MPPDVIWLAIKLGEAFIHHPDGPLGFMTRICVSLAWFWFSRAPTWDAVSP